MGAGQAGGRAAEALRAAGFAGEVVLLGEERHEPYERPRLSKSVLLNDEPAAATFIHPRDWYAAQGIDLRSRARVEAIAPKSRIVITAAGQRLEYTKLLLCTGSRVRPLTGAPDGLAVDKQGHIWATAPGGVYCFTPEGKVLGRLNTGQRTANCKFGDDGKTLFICADMYLCRVKTNATGTNY